MLWLKGLHDPRSKTVKQIISVSHKSQDSAKEVKSENKGNISYKKPEEQAELKWPYLRKIDL